jgi:filamentous hemagglutinin family protein
MWMMSGDASLTQMAQAELIYTNDLSTVVSGEMQIPDSRGELEGNNLFHSFDTFNVQQGESATFTGPGSVINIIATVTGTGNTLIDGLLKSDIAQADLFLMNPNGIVFGPDAALDVDGSLYFSTSSSLIFTDGSRLFLSDSGNSALTSAAPSAFGFLENTAAPIALENAVLSNKGGTGLSLIAGDITLTNSSIYIPDGGIDMVSLQGTGEISLSPEDRTTTSSGGLGNIQILNEGIGELQKISTMIQRYGKRVADLDVSGANGGRVNLMSGDLDITRGFVFADTRDAGHGLGISVQADSHVSLSAGSRITTDSLGDGDAGDIEINSQGAIWLSDSSTIASDARGTLGNGGTIIMSAERVLLESLSQIKTTANSHGDGGEIIIDAASVDLKSGASIAGQTIGQGRGGDIQITASEFMIFEGQDLERNIDSGVSVSTLGAGDGGTISLIAPSLALRGGASIRAFSGGQSEVTGRAGSIRIQSEELNIDADSSIDANSYSTANAGKIELLVGNISLAGDGAQISSQAIGSGDGGAIEISTEVLRISDSAELAVSTLASGSAGEISVSASRIDLANGTIEAGTSGSGKGGEVTLVTNDLTITRGGIINTGTRGSGDAGKVLVRVSETLFVSDVDSSISSRSGFGDSGLFGEGGSISIHANSIELDHQARIEATSSGTGFAGDLAIFADNNLHLGNASAFKTNSINSGGGNISVDVINQIILDRSTVTASAGGVNASDDSGNVNIDPVFLILKESSILAQANFGDGGAIFLSADNYIQDINSVLDASSRRGNDGEITIASPDNNITGVLGVLNTSFISDSSLLSEPCAALAFDDRSSLIVVTKQIQTKSPTGYVDRNPASPDDRDSCSKP